MSRTKEEARVYFAAHKDRIRELSKQRYAKDPEKFRALSRSNYRRFHEKIRTERNIARSEWTDAQKLQDRLYQQARFSEPRHRIKQLIHAAKGRAKKHGLEFSDDLYAWVTEFTPLECCDCCGVRYEYARGKGWKNRDDSPTLDKIDPVKDYVRDNVAIICWRCNRLKSNGSLVEFQNLVAYMERQCVSTAASA